MKKIIGKIKSALFLKSYDEVRRERTEAYLAKSTDLADLERRIRELEQRGW